MPPQAWHCTQCVGRLLGNCSQLVRRLLGNSREVRLVRALQATAARQSFVEAMASVVVGLEEA